MTTPATPTPHADPASNSQTPIIEARALTKHFGGTRHLFTRSPTVYAVNDVSFAVAARRDVRDRRRIGLRQVHARPPAAPFDRRRPTAASSIRARTSRISGAPLRRLRREMQIIFQDPFASLNPGMTIGQIVGEPIALHGLARNGAEHRERVAQLLRTVGLQPAYADRFPHEFSGGQRQRIGIARALAGEPKLIVGDEPVSALDVSVQAQVINLLETLKQDLGLTLIMVAHDLAVIRHMSDRVAVMYLGEIVELANVDALFDAPLHPYTQALLRAIPASSPHERRAKPALSGDLPSPTAPPSGLPFPYALSAREAALRASAADQRTTRRRTAGRMPLLARDPERRRRRTAGDERQPEIDRAARDLPRPPGDAGRQRRLSRWSR